MVHLRKWSGRSEEVKPRESTETKGQESNRQWAGYKHQGIATKPLVTEVTLSQAQSSQLTFGEAEIRPSGAYQGPSSE